MTVHQDVLASCVSAGDFLQPAIEGLPGLHQPRLAEIQAAVARHFGLHPSELLTARRDREVARPRQLAMYLAKQLTAKSLPTIGRHFGGRDHTTVMHAVRTIDVVRRRDGEYNEAIGLCALRLARTVAERLSIDPTEPLQDEAAVA